MARYCEHAGCPVAIARRKLTCRACPECGYALHQRHSPLRYIALPGAFAVFILMAVRMCGPASLDDGRSSSTHLTYSETTQSTHTPKPSGVSAPSLPSVPATGTASETATYLREKAELLADEIKLSDAMNASSLAKALARKGGPGEIKSPELLTAVIYRWVANNVAYDVASLNPTTRAPQNPDFILKARKAVCEGYACLFDFLLSQNQIEARIVHGMARTEPGTTQLTTKEHGHAWIIVKWDGKWHLLEPTWGAGFVNRRHFEKSFTWDWFDVKPEVAIYTHIPEEDWMRLMDSRISIEQIGESACLNPLFFESVYSDPLPMLLGLIALDAKRNTVSWRVRNGYSVMLSAISTQAPEAPPTPGKRFTLPSGVAEFSFPSLPSGDYTLNVHASRPGSTDYVACGSFLLRQSGSGTTKHPPITFKIYDELGAQLLEPLEGNLISGTWRRFAVRAEPGLSLALQMEGETTLNYLSETDGVHEVRILLRKGILRLWQVSGNNLLAMVEFSVD